MDGLALLQSSTAEILSHPTWDILLVFALLAGGFFYGISAGKRRIAATIIYTYVTIAVTSALPIERLASSPAGGFFPGTSPFWIETGAFLAIFILLALLLGSSRQRRGFAPASSWWQVFLLSFAQVGLLIHIVLGFLPGEQIETLAPLTRTVLANPAYHLWWLLAPLIILVLLSRFEAREE